MSTEGRILVVDDNEHNRLLTRAQLDAAGYEVTLANDGPSALDLLAVNRYDLVFLDVLMPGMDGFETCRRLRALPHGADVPVVFLTALSDHETHEQALLSGGDDFLGKPINRTELLIRARSLIRITRLQAEVRRERDRLMLVQRQKDLLSALVVHDLKNPLASILANGHFVLSCPDVVGEARDAMQDVMTSSEVMLQMVMNLLDISQAEEGKLRITADAIDVGAEVDALSGRVRRRLETRKQKLVVAIEPELPVLRADRALIRRTLENLVDNCIKYTPGGGTITVEAATAGRWLEIRVRDEGLGIPAEQRERLFDKYAQADARASDRTSRGLGLVFCRIAAEAHGGRIDVRENHPRGSVFVLTLPQGATTTFPPRAPAEKLSA